MLRIDHETAQEKIKMYTQEDKLTPKGDCTVFYARPESVEVAMDLLNGAEIKPGFKVTIEMAKFEQKGDYKQRERKEIDEVAKIRFKTKQENQFSWNEADEGEGLRIVVIKNLFKPEELEDNPEFANTIEEGVKEECESQIGIIKRLTLFEQHPDGVVQIKFDDPKAAEQCIKLMNGRFFAGKELECFYWDGKTNYRVVKESAQEEKQRIEGFGDMIERMPSAQGGISSVNIDDLMNQLIGSDSEDDQEKRGSDPNDGDKTPEQIHE